MTQDIQFTSQPPLSLYIHLPWCIKKCPYCDFNSHESSTGKIEEEKYIDSLIRDFESSLSLIHDRDIVSIFIGGGTPSLFTAQALERLLTTIDQHIGLKAGVEVSLEANPGAADHERFAAYRQIGINRLSIGIQSFNTDHLKSIGRVHNGDQAQDAIRFAKAAGFDQINLDLMYGLPGQQLEHALQDLNSAISQDTVHLSWYQLTLEPNTLFYKKPPVLPIDEKIWEIQDKGKVLLTEAGFKNYEISAYARNEKYCQHNLNYWQFGDYLGIGAGAHSKITDPDKNMISRYTRHKIPDRYMQLSGKDEMVTGNWQLSIEDTILEFMMNSLRLSDGFSTLLFEERTGLSINSLKLQLDKAKQCGWLDITDEKIIPTNKGLTFLNDLLQCFMPQSS